MLVPHSGRGNGLGIAPILLSADRKSYSGVVAMADVRASGLITMTFDDGLLCQFENGYSVLCRNGVKGVVFIPTGLVGGWHEGQRSMSRSHLRELAAAGWEVASHTVSHTRLANKAGQTRLPLSAVEVELHESREWLIANGFPVIAFAYPNGRYNDEIEAIACRYYRYVRTTENGLNEVSSGERRLKAFDLCQRKVYQWRPAVDAARVSKKWLIAMIHGVARSADQIPTGQESLWIARDDLADCLQYVLSSGLPVRTFQEVYDGCQDLPERAERISDSSQRSP